MGNEHDVLLRKEEIERDADGRLSKLAVKFLRLNLRDTLGMSLDDTTPSMFVNSRGYVSSDIGVGYNRGRLPDDYAKMSEVQRDISMITTIMSQSTPHGYSNERTVSSINLLSGGMTKEALAKFVKDGYLIQDGPAYRATDTFKIESYNIFVSY